MIMIVGTMVFPIPRDAASEASIKADKMCIRDSMSSGDLFGSTFTGSFSSAFSSDAETAAVSDASCTVSSTEDTSSAEEISVTVSSASACSDVGSEIGITGLEAVSLICTGVYSGKMCIRDRQRAVSMML